MGELNIRIVGGHTVVESMRRGMSPKGAVLEALKRVSKLYNDDKKRWTNSTSSSTRCARTANTRPAHFGAVTGSACLYGRS